MIFESTAGGNGGVTRDAIAARFRGGAQGDDAPLTPREESALGFMWLHFKKLDVDASGELEWDEFFRAYCRQPVHMAAACVQRWIMMRTRPCRLV